MAAKLPIYQKALINLLARLNFGFLNEVIHLLSYQYRSKLQQKMVEGSNPLEF